MPRVVTSYAVGSFTAVHMDIESAGPAMLCVTVMLYLTKRGEMREASNFQERIIGTVQLAFAKPGYRHRN